MEAQQIVREMADENGMISPEVREVDEPSVDVNINIRQDDLRLFETASGRQLIQTGEMDEGVFVEPVPSKNGFIAELVIEPEVEFTETAPAEPAEQPSVDNGSPVEIRMD